MQYSTIGKEIYTGREVKLCCRTEINGLTNERINDRFRIIYVKEGFGIFNNGENSQLVTAPSIICLNESETAEIIDQTDLKLEVLYFEPTCFSQEITFEILNKRRNQLFEDFWFFRPFMERNETYIGASNTNHYLGNRISQLIALTDQELTGQKDGYWPCRSRSFFIELLLLVNSVYDNDEGFEKIVIGKMTSEIRDVANYIHIHYPDKITMEAITKSFHTNKTTMNQKFKAVMGLTVIEYLNNLRMQITCSFLRRTELTVGEIMERVGYRDDAHFLRAFRKFAHCTPSGYRTQHVKV